MRRPIREWAVRYSADGPTRKVGVPHSWRQDVPLTFEGPGFYGTSIEVPDTDCWLEFQGVSYEASISIDGVHVLSHRGIWDAFHVDLRPYRGRNVELEVRVVKNGGQSFPVREVASGFLPYVFGTFGGIYGDVEIVDSIDRPPRPRSRVGVNAGEIFLDGEPFYLRGLLSWGWYPDVGHTNPDAATIRTEIVATRAMGFNLIKFCLWVPSHRYLEILKEERMEAWIELPLWDPTSDPQKQTEIAADLRRIVEQYAHHDNVIVWTVGCELNASTSPAYREALVSMVHEITGCPLVRDNSGGAEMYGGDLREFGSFEDFHPYCDTQFYAPVLDTLLPGPRPSRPVLLGEFNDFDVVRDITRLSAERPFWASQDPDLNNVGVRWQHDLPGIVAGPIPENERVLIEASRQKAVFVRKQVHEMVRGRGEISGYVVTGMRDTPISTSGFFDDWGQARFTARECTAWNGANVLFRIPIRRPPWVAGGNRPGFLDASNFFAGDLFWRIGIHSEIALEGRLEWHLSDSVGGSVASGVGTASTVRPLRSCQVGEIFIAEVPPGSYTLKVRFGQCSNEWPIWVVDPISTIDGWRTDDPSGRLEALGSEGSNLLTTRPESVSGRSILFLENEGTVPLPFWRENIATFSGSEFWAKVPFADRWDRLFPLSPDRAIDPQWLAERKWGPIKVLMERVDTRTYVRHAYIASIGDVLVTTLRPYGGLGSCPTNLASNPAGVELIRSLTSTFES
jgi:hypothetical protein